MNIETSDPGKASHPMNQTTSTNLTKAQDGLEGIYRNGQRSLEHPQANSEPQKQEQLRRVEGKGRRKDWQPWVCGKTMGTPVWVQIPALCHTSCVNFDYSHNFSEPQFSTVRCGTIYPAVRTCADVCNMPDV